MFDIAKVAKHIRELRISKNMTQMNLADELGVSYQAVSNWERGNSMPDISKLEDLSRIFSCTIDELLGASRETEAVKKVVLQETHKLKLKDVALVSPVLNPEQSEQLAEAIGIGEQGEGLQELVELAPFLSEKAIDRMLKQCPAKSSLGKNSAVAGLAPFLGEKSMNELAESVIEAENWKVLTAIAPFVSNWTLRKAAAVMVEKGRLKELESIAPYM
ncbi:MAG: helix-turn-helix transcriptional regulator [Lachnospiraceae bacterium]|nr:helix-turn-helix transcriptional regulator [Lachnospiraceae bacterium]